MTASLQPQLRRASVVPLVMFPGLSGRRGVPKRFERWRQRHEIAEFSGERAVLCLRRRTGLADGTSVQDLAGDYAATLRQLFDGPVDVIGVSTGGSIALQLAADHPQLVRRLVLVSAAHRLGDHGRATQQRVAELLRQNRPRRAASVFLGATGATAPSRAALSVAGLLAPRIVVGRHDPDLLVTLDAEDSFDLTPRLGEIQTPTLVTAGARDRFYTPQLFADTCAAMPRAQLELYPRRGHLGTLGNRPLARRILRFLASATE